MLVEHQQRQLWLGRLPEIGALAHDQLRINAEASMAASAEKRAAAIAASAERSPDSTSVPSVGG
jgi:hypothetical protein